MFDGRFRTTVDRCTRPIGRALARTGLSPDHLTAAGLVLSVPTAVVIGSGRLLLGFALLVLSAVPDLLDGALAKAAGRASVRGAFFDSVADRVTDALVLGGIAWYLQSHDGGHAFVLPVAVLGVSMLVSYERAKAESLGLHARGGLMERAERVVVLCAGLAFPILLVPMLWVLLVLTAVTAVQRFVKVWRQAPGAAASPQSSPMPHRPRSVPVSERWRTWLDSPERRRTGAYRHGSRRATSAERWRARRMEREDADGDTRRAAGGRGSRRP